MIDDNKTECITVDIKDYMNGIKQQLTDSCKNEKIQLQREMDLKFIASQEQHKQFQISIDARMEKMNEFRGAMQDVQAKMITRSEHDALILNMEQKFALMQTNTDQKFEGVKQLNVVLFLGLGVVILGAFVLHMFGVSP